MSQSTSMPDVIPPPPPGTNYIAVIRPALTPLITATLFDGMFIPMLATLFLLSTRELRRQPIFVLNVLVLLLGLAMCTLSIAVDISTIIPTFNNTTLIIVVSVLTVFAPILVESVLFVRILAVYPWSRISTRAKLAIYGFPVAMRIARTVNAAVNTGIIYRHINPADSADVLIASARSWRRYSTKLECFLQLFDNTYVSVLFLWKLRQAAQMSSSIRVRSSSSYAKRVRSLMWIVACNFIIPDILSLVQLVVLFHDPNAAIYVFDIFFANPCVEIISVLFATVWAASNHWQADQSAPPTFSLSLHGARMADAASDQSQTRHPRLMHSPSAPLMAAPKVLVEKEVHKDSTTTLSV